MQKKLLSTFALLGSLAVTPFIHAQEITLYSGRGETLVKPIIEQFEKQSGIKVKVRYGDTAQLAVLLQEEGARSPADVYWGQDAGAMGALANAGLLATLPEGVYKKLPDIYTSKTGQWVAASGRSRVIAYSTERVLEKEIPASIFELTQEKYQGRMGLAPTNGGFQSFVTAMRVQHGDEKTLAWLKAIKKNQPKLYRNNTAQVQAIGDGEIDFVLVNNYYLPRFVAANSAYPAKQTYFSDGDIGNLVNVAGVALLKSSKKQPQATQFIEYMLSPAAQQYFTSVVGEYPVTQGIIPNPVLGDLETLLNAAPSIDLDQLADLEGTLKLLRDAGLL
ncbi:iron ABC transporter substrate-binding protein [Vibrio cincinnatiensis]|uniref:iron ABC transporter substrate-binding protein n=1 Tax=Vibrio cincinnatiensis TaxID=675 RepID=UPI001EDF9EF4|nr:iron ABC transporter substrate-binding protein [Vibrio cincinnatiensis]MCG3766259.1 iron ABC transporter substrate-binding protein [Vibrio cincinnatiensis]